MIKTTRQSVFQRATSLFAGLVILCAQSPASAARARQSDSKPSQVTATPVPLEAGKPLERELSAGETHAYALALAAGQYLHLVVDQRSIGVVATLLAPDGRKLSEVDSPNGTTRSRSGRKRWVRTLLSSRCR
jgi:hypothetical protein